MNRLYWTKLVGGAPCPCWTDHGGRLLCTPISVTLVHEEHLTDDAPYGYISNTAQEPHLTCPTSWASKTKLTVEQHEHWTHLAPFKYLSRRRQVPQTICAISAADQNVSSENNYNIWDLQLNMLARMPQLLCAFVGWKSIPWTETTCEYNCVCGLITHTAQMWIGLILERVFLLT